VTLFGTLRLSVDHNFVPDLPLKAQWLLAMLVLANGHTVDRDEVAALLWPETKASDPRGLLRSTLLELRKALGPAADRLPIGKRKTISLELTGAFVDVIEFDRDISHGDPASLRNAVALYRADLLAACQEEWIVPERQRRAEAYAEAMRRLQADSPARSGGLTKPDARPLSAISSRPGDTVRQETETEAATLGRLLQEAQTQIADLSARLFAIEEHLNTLFARKTPPQDAVKADTFYNLGVDALLRGEAGQARTYLVQALVLTEENPGEVVRESHILDQLGMLAMWEGNADQARTCFERSFNLSAAQHDQKGLVSSFLHLGDVASTLAVANTYYERALQVAQNDGNAEGVAWSNLSLAHAPLFRKEWTPDMLANTLKHYRQAFQSFEQRNQTAGIVICLDGLTRLLLLLQREREAAHILRAADAMRAAFHIPRLPNEEEEFRVERERLNVLSGAERDGAVSVFSRSDAARIVLSQLQKLEEGLGKE
jgi:tetratricopeptide (TPR) repeat protein